MEYLMQGDDFKTPPFDLASGANGTRTYETGDSRAADAGQYLPAGTILGDRWEVQELIGEGGMSVVYKTRHQVMGKFAAAKVLHSHLAFKDKNMQRFQQEARAASQVSHPNVISVYDCGVTSQGQAFMMMEFLPGKSLAEVIKSGPLPFDRCIKIFKQICEGLSAAHKKGIVHRDLKPSNVMLLENGVYHDLVKIVDFGIARLLPREGEQDENSHQLTQTGEIFGSPLYMSPEQCMGRKPNARSDVYSMGCLMYETLCGAPPLRGESFLETMHKQVEEMPDSFAKGKLGGTRYKLLEAVIFKALAKSPDDRYQTMDELWNDIEAAASPMAVFGFMRSRAARDFLKRWRAAKKKQLFLIRLAIVAAAMSIPVTILCLWLLQVQRQFDEIPVGMNAVHYQYWPRPWAFNVSPRTNFKQALELKQLVVRKYRDLYGKDRDMSVNGLVAALEGRGDVYLDSGFYQKALADFSEAADIKRSYLGDQVTEDFQFRELESRKARCLYALGESDRAIRSLQSLVEETDRSAREGKFIIMEAFEIMAEVELKKNEPDYRKALSYLGAATDMIDVSALKSKPQLKMVLVKLNCLKGEVQRILADANSPNEIKYAQLLDKVHHLSLSGAPESILKKAHQERDDMRKGSRYLKRAKFSHGVAEEMLKRLARQGDEQPEAQTMLFWGYGLLGDKFSMDEIAESSFVRALNELKKVDDPRALEIEAQIKKDYAIHLAKKNPLKSLLVKLGAADCWTRSFKNKEQK